MRTLKTAWGTLSQQIKLIVYVTISFVTVGLVALIFLIATYNPQPIKNDVNTQIVASDEPTSNSSPTPTISPTETPYMLTSTDNALIVSQASKAYQAYCTLTQKESQSSRIKRLAPYFIKYSTANDGNFYNPLAASNVCRIISVATPTANSLTEAEVVVSSSETTTSQDFDNAILAPEVKDVTTHLTLEKEGNNWFVSDLN